MNKTKIEWCDYTWNPVTGCEHGCEYCYARDIAKRFGFHYQTGDNHVLDEKYCITEDCIMTGAREVHCSPYPYDFDPTFHRYRLDEPARKKKGVNIFVSSMGDLFGDWVPNEWIEQVFEACKKAPQHNYMFLTKNPKRYSEVYRNSLDYRCYMWLGTTATEEESFNTNGSELFHNTGLDLPKGKRVNRFMSIEPLLGEIHKYSRHNIKHLDWVIVGAETGNRKDKIVPKREWIELLVEQCRAANIPVFLKDNLKDFWGEELIQEFPKQLSKD